MNEERTVADLKADLGKKNVALIDVREYADYANGYIRGSKLIPMEEIVSRHTEIDRTQTVYLICTSGARSFFALEELQELGFDNLINVKGGFEAWKRANFPFERDDQAPWSLERQVRFGAGLLVLTGVLLSIFVHPYLIGLAAFVGAGLTFAGATNWCGMGLLLAKMPWNQRPTINN